MHFTVKCENAKFVYSDIPNELIKQLKLRYDEEKCKDMNEVLRLNYNMTGNVYDVLEYAFDHLNIKKFDDNVYSLEIDEDISLEANRLSTLVDYINYGDLTAKGTHLVDDIFNYITSNINKIYNEYTGGIGGI